MIKLIKHRHALIIFWINVGIFATVSITSFAFVLSEFETWVSLILLIVSMAVIFPMMVWIPSGKFKKGDDKK